MNHFQSGKGLFNHPQNFGILKFPSVVTLEKAGRGAQEGKADGEVCCHCLCCLSGQRLQKAELREMVLGDHDVLVLIVRLRLHVDQVRLPTMPRSWGDDWLDHQGFPRSRLLERTVQARVDKAFDDGYGDIGKLDLQLVVHDVSPTMSGQLVLMGEDFKHLFSWTADLFQLLLASAEPPPELRCSTQRVF